MLLIAVPVNADLDLILRLVHDNDINITFRTRKHFCLGAGFHSH